MDFFGRGIVNLRKETFITFDKIARTKNPLPRTSLHSILVYIYINFLASNVELSLGNAPPFVGQDFGGCARIWRGGVTFPFGQDRRNCEFPKRSRVRTVH